MLVKDYSVEEVIAESERLENANDRLFLLRQWTRRNRHHEDAADVIEYALSTAIKSTPYTFNATVLRELAIPLPFITNQNRAKQLVGVFDSQQGAVEPLGPTEDFIRLQLLLARAEIKRDFNASLNRVTDVYLRACSINDGDLRATCLAWLASSLAAMDPDKKFEEERAGKIHSAVKLELGENLDHLRASTGDQYEATKGVINALARYEPDLAVEVAMSLNTKFRRNNALVDYFESTLEAPIGDIDFHRLNKHLDLFTQSNAQDAALLKIVEHLWDNFQISNSIISSILPIVQKLKKVGNAVAKCSGCSMAYVLLMTADPSQIQFAESLLSSMEESWQAIDIGWIRTRTGFEVCSTIAKYSPQKAREYLTRTESDRDEMKMSFGGSAEAYMLTLRLALRAYSGLLPRDVQTDEDVLKLRDVINVIPSRGERAALWSELAIRYYIAGKSDECRRIVREHITPLLSTLSAIDRIFKAAVVTLAAPALYCAHHEAALMTISELADGDRESAYREIALFLLQKMPPGEPNSLESAEGHDITFEDALDLCSILEFMVEEWNIYFVVKSVADTMSVSKYRDRFSRSQKQTIVEKLRAILSEKLPNPENIQHDGYKIACNIQLNRIEESIRGKTVTSWDALAAQAAKIPNLADRSYVQGILASALPARDSAKRNRLFEQVKESIALIPIIYDKVLQYEALASITVKSHQSLARKCLEEAMNLCVQANDPSLDEPQRKIIDVAYRLDPNLASSLAERIDDDPAKLRVKQNLRRQMGIHNLRNRMLDQTNQQTTLSTAEKTAVSRAAWDNLGALNSNRIASVRTEHTRDWIQVAGDMPLRDAYPIVAWTVENAVRRFAKTNQARSYLRPIYDAIIEGVELCGKLTNRSLSIAKRTTRSVHTASRISLLVRSGHREEALSYLRDWFFANVKGYLKICDPYFGPEDLEVLQLIRSAKPDCKIQILTSRKHNERLTPSIEEAFRAHWKISYDQPAPDTVIVIVGTDIQGQLPIHDRWWLTENAGLRIGTSYNSLGLNRNSEISMLRPQEALSREVEVDQYLSLKKREHQGRRLLYMMFTL